MKSEDNKKKLGKQMKYASTGKAVSRQPTAANNKWYKRRIQDSEWTNE